MVAGNYKTTIMTKEKIEALIKNALKESTFIHQQYGEVSLAKNDEISVFLHPEFEEGIDLDEGEVKVKFTFNARFVTRKDENGSGTENITSYNDLIATISIDTSKIEQPIRFR